MGEGQGQERTQQVTEDPDQAAAQLRAEIEEVREDLGETVEALAAKTDVKARAREKADELKRTAADKLPNGGSSGAGSPAAGATSAVQQLRVKARQNPVPTAALGALLGGFVIGRLTSRGDAR